MNGTVMIRIFFHLSLVMYRGFFSFQLYIYMLDFSLFSLSPVCWFSLSSSMGFFPSCNRPIYTVMLLVWSVHIHRVIHIYMQRDWDLPETLLYVFDDRCSLFYFEVLWWTNVISVLLTFAKVVHIGQRLINVKLTLH